MAARGGEQGIGEAMSKVWSYLDHLAESDPGEYQKFIEQAMRERKEFLEPPLPVLCFSAGIRGKESQMLYVNVCQWSRVPEERETEQGSTVPMKGGILRHLLENGKKKTNCLLIDVAFSPSFIASYTTDSDTKEMIISLTLDFLEDYLSSILTDRNTRVVTEVKFKGPEADIVGSLDQRSEEMITRESRLDFGDSLLSSLRRQAKKEKTKSEGANGLPPLLPWQQPAPPNSGNQATKRLIQEVPNTKNSHTKEKKAGKSGQKKDDSDSNSDSKNSRCSGETSECASGAECESGEGVRKCVPANRVTLGEEGGVGMVIVMVKLPEVTSIDQITLDGSQADLSVTAGDVYSLLVPLPVPVNPDLSRATFNKRSRTLRVKIPTINQT